MNGLPIVRREEVPGGPDGTRATLRRMRDMVRASASDATVSAAVARLMSKPGGRTPAGYLAHTWRLLEGVPYEFDPPDRELIRTPDALLAGLAGDCDDQTVLAGALLTHPAAPTRSLPAELVAVGLKPGSRNLSHVFLRAGGVEVDPITSNPGNQVPPRRPLGWHVGKERPIYALMEEPL